MDDKNICSKVIKQVCKEILIPLGVFQKGTSRLYLDDNDYFFTVVEFQPSNWSKGTYLNIGLTFLWDSNQNDVLRFSFSRKPAARYCEFVEYADEVQFRKEVTHLVNIAKEEILFYRKLKDIKFAKNWMIGYSKKFGKNKYAIFGLDIANVCALNQNADLAKLYFENYRKEQNSNEQSNYDIPNREHLVSNIEATRKMWHDKSSMKKMPISALYDI